MKILGIETSCDETALAIASGSGDTVMIEKSVVLSQIKKHAKYGGVVPEVAAREHIKALFPMLEHELPRDGKGIDVIAVTCGPGLAPALRVGVEAAKTLAWIWKKPLVGVNHLEGHIYANWITESQVPSFPALCLIVSGGHTELILMHDYGKYERLGETLDDAAGEAFDKVAKMLGLGYPGGPEIAKLAEGGNKEAFDFPRGLIERPGFDFSFSGLKTSVLYKLRKLTDDRGDEFDEKTRRDVAASFQEAVVDVLVQKTLRAAKKHAPSSIILAGGVAANKELRSRLTSQAENVFVPELKYSMDNAAMIAAAGYFRARAEDFVDPLKLEADPNLELV